MPTREPVAPSKTRVSEESSHRLLLACIDGQASIALPALQTQTNLQVVIASEAGGVLSMLSSEAIEVVVLESLSGSGSTIDLCRRIRRDPRFTGVGILTIVGQGREAAAEALEAGSNDVLAVPTAAGVVVSRIQSLVAARPQVHHGRLDPLTDLPGRSDFRRIVANRLTENAYPVAVILLDIDRFKKINDSLGHDFGDLVLGEFARRLTAALGGPTAGRALARYGGDEIAVMLGDLARVGDVAQAARSILSALTRPLLVGDREIFVTVSVGAAVAPADGETAELLLRNAETAMYAAKKAGRDTFRFYTDPMSASVVRKFDLENKLRRALEREELSVVYQPIVQARRQTLVGFEALLRWSQPGDIGISPEEFIPMAEETGLIVEIGEWVLRRACEQGKEWNRQATSPVRVTVNVSHRQLRSRGFVSSVARILDDTGLDARLLELEITESSVVRNERETLTALHQLKVQGIRLAVDDFGTGHSAMSYLKKFPLNTLKIDQSFTRGITTDADDAAIITATINMAHGLNMTVVAEGVELEEQLYFLSQNKCDEVQGFLFSHPLDGPEATRRLQSQTWGPAAS
jgi:diguanylate cyclase (GGDEF)-like protein